MDFVIVGGGIYGCGVAWELAKRGAEVLLLEAKKVASGASGGLGRRGVRANGRDLRELPLMAAAYQIWPTLHEAIDAPTGYVRCGQLLLIEREQDMIRAPAQLWVQTQHGIQTELVKGEVLATLEPDLSPQVVGALHCPLDGIADHTATTRGLAKAAAKLGAQLREQTKVVAMERRGDRITALICEGDERIPIAGTLLLLSNHSVPGLLFGQLRIRLPVWTYWPQVLLTESIEPMPVRHLIGHIHRLLAMKPNLDGRIMISGGWRGRWNHEQQRGETILENVTRNLADSQAVYPALAGIQVTEAKADRPEAYCIDDIPIIDRVPGIVNAFFATGWSGHGWALAPALFPLLAEWAFTQQQPPLLQPFSIGRFAKKV